MFLFIVELNKKLDYKFITREIYYIYFYTLTLHYINDDIERHELKK